MRTSLVFALVLAGTVTACGSVRSQESGVDAQPARELAGLWEAKLRFGPDIYGTLTMEHAAGGWSAEIAGQSIGVHLVGDTMTFELPDGRGSFRGRLESKRERIVGHWTQPATVSNGTRYASPVTLGRGGNAERWRGDVDPLADELGLPGIVWVISSA